MELLSVEPKEVFFVVALSEEEIEDLANALDNSELKVDIKTVEGQKQEKAIQQFWEFLESTLKDYRGAK